MSAAVGNLSGTLRRAGDVLRARGPLHLARRALRKIGLSLVEGRRLTYFVRELDGPLPEAPVPPGCHIRLATPADIPLVLDASDASRTAATVSRRFERGDHCVLALDAAGRAVHSRWVTTTRAFIPELRMTLALGPGEAYFYDGHTRADRRGDGLDGAVRCFIFAWLRGAGFSRAYSYVRGDNPAACRAAQRWQRPTGTLSVLRVLGFTPAVAGLRWLEGPSLVPRDPADLGDRDDARRDQLTRTWFESWIREPLAKRSTGFDAMPEAYFASTARYIADTLRLDPHADRVLDVGCDSAMVSRLVARHCRELVGVDFVAGMLADIRGEAPGSPGGRATFIAADGRFLPFSPQAFDKVYCTGVIHVLPTRDDGVRMIEELVRVCKPGGHVLVAAIPDVGKRRRALADTWNRASAAGKLAFALSLALPRPLKAPLKHLLGTRWDHRVILLDYDVGALARRLTARGFPCEILDFPAHYWSRDFRRTRSNLLIAIPAPPTDDRSARVGARAAAVPAAD